MSAPATSDARAGSHADPLALLTYVSEPDGPISVTYMSARIQAVLGYSLDELSAPDGFRALVHADDRDRVLAGDADPCGGGRSEYRMLARDGSEIWVSDDSHSVDADGPGSACIMGTVLDISVHKQVELELRTSEEQFRSVVANIPGVVYRCACDAEWTMRFMSEHIEEVAGYPAGDFIGNQVRSFGSIIHADDRRGVVAGIDEALAEGTPYSLQYRIVHADGTPRWIAEQGRAILDSHGRRLWLDGVILDITRRKRAEQARGRAEAQLRRQAEINRHQALHDSLTGLPNRTLFHDRIDRVLVESQRKDAELAVLMLDLDRFKEINDTLGHASGDRLLQEVANRMLGALRKGDSIARLGGDEFGLLLPGASPAVAVEVAERVRHAVNRPFVLDGLPLTVDASVGIASHPADGSDVDVLLQRADVAMYVAKETHSGHAAYSHDDDRHKPKRLSLVGELRRAIDEGELVLHYQPKVALGSGRVTGVEALVRWRHPELGLVMPDEFIPVAQQTGLIGPLTLYVIDEALRQCSAWDEQGHVVPVAVNISPRSLIDAKFGDDVEGLLRKWGVGHDRLELEITEDAIVADPKRVQAVLERLDGMGIRLAVDDFGTGYSSLAYLARLPIDELKIDKAFILRMLSSKHDAIIVRSMIELGRNLGLEVVAEGVEDAPTLTRLRWLGCDIAQGYFVSRPVPAEELTAWLESLPRVDGAPEWQAPAESAEPVAL